VVGVTLALLWLFQAIAGAGIYKWRDDQGKWHFTDDRGKIPLQYRENTQRFKGVTEPKPKEEPPAEEEPEEPQAEAKKAPPEKKPKPAAAPQLTKEDKATMTAVYQPLLMVWNKHVQLLMEGEPVDKKLKHYVMGAQRSAVSKRAIVKTIGDNEHPLLVEIKSFLKKSAKKDARLEMDNPSLINYVTFFRERLMEEIPKENDFIRKLHQKLGMKKESPLIPLEEALKQAAERREIIKKNNEKKKQSYKLFDETGL
jgi:hypothetical protein